MNGSNFKSLPSLSSSYYCFLRLSFCLHHFVFNTLRLFSVNVQWLYPTHQSSFIRPFKSYCCHSYNQLQSPSHTINTEVDSDKHLITFGNDMWFSFLDVGRGALEVGTSAGRKGITQASPSPTSTQFFLWPQYIQSADCSHCGRISSKDCRIACKLWYSDRFNAS